MIATGPPQPRRELVAAVTIGLALLALAPRPRPAWRTVADTAASGGASVDPTASIVALVALVAWTLAGWYVLGALLVLGSRLPGLGGRLAAVLATRTLPLAVRRSLQVALGVGLTLGTVTAGPATASAPAPATAPAPAPATAPTPAAAGRDAGTPGQPAGGVSLDWPSGPVAAPVTGSMGPAAGSPSHVPSARHSAVVVVPGDTLWALAERSLRAQGDPTPSVRSIAAQWPAWWSANRETVGEDPDLLHPGTRLLPPPAG